MKKGMIEQICDDDGNLTSFNVLHRCRMNIILYCTVVQEKNHESKIFPTLITKFNGT